MEELIYQMMDHIEEAVITVNLRLEVVFINKKATEILQVKRDEILNHNLYDYFEQPAKGLITKALNHEEESKNVHFHKKIGQKDHFFTITTRLLKKEKKVAGVMLFAKEITDEKIQQESLQKEKKELNLKFYKIFNSANDMMILTKKVGEKHIFIDINKKGLETLGFNREEFLSLNTIDIVSTDSVGKIFYVQDLLEKDGKTPPIDWVYKTKFGNDVPMEMIITYIPMNEEKVYLTVARDIREAEQQKLEFDSFVMTLINSLQYGFLVAENGLITIANDAVYRIYNLDPNKESLVGLTSKEFYQRLHEKYLEPEKRLEKLRKTIYSEKETLNQEVELRDGRVLEYDYIPVFVKGVIKSHIWMIRDITSRKENENRLTLAKEEAVRANQAKSVFLSQMSHDLRTPLNSIVGFSQVLLESEDLSYLVGHKEKIKRILKSGELLSSLIKDMIDFSSIEFGEIRQNIQPNKLKPIIDECIRTVQKEAEKKEIMIFSQFISSTLCLAVDEVRFKQIILNLLSNAIKYNSFGGNVILEAREEDDFVFVYVKDSGFGIPLSEQEKIFLPMYRGMQYKESGIEGSGIGLAIVAELTMKMNGIYGVSSEEGKGSVFWVSFPKSVCLPAQGEQETVNHFKSDKESFHILYVEDNMDNFSLVQEIVQLANGNYELYHAKDGESGLQFILECDPDLILLDMNLPDISGEEVLKRVKQIPEKESIPILVLSANALKEQKERAFFLGCSEYITKPLVIRDFLSMLQKYKLQKR